MRNVTHIRLALATALFVLAYLVSPCLLATPAAGQTRAAPSSTAACRGADSDRHDEWAAGDGERFNNDSES